MLKLACPHCQTIGVVPELLMNAGDWPIACHYCHQHYYAPVLSSPEKMERQIELSCNHCAHTSRLDFASFSAIAEQEFELFCPKCHHNLSKSLTHITHILTEAVSPPQAALPSEETQDLVQPEHKNAALPAPSLSHQAVAGFGLIGFGFTLAAVLAAQEGLIARDWLDHIFIMFENLPDFLKQVSLLIQA